MRDVLRERFDAHFAQGMDHDPAVGPDGGRFAGEVQRHDGVGLLGQ